MRFISAPRLGSRSQSSHAVINVSRIIVTVKWMSFLFASRRRHTRFDCDWSSDVCSSDLMEIKLIRTGRPGRRWISLISIGRDVLGRLSLSEDNKLMPARFQVGTARRIITPPTGVELAGLGYYLNRTWERVRDDLAATALVIGDGQS